MFIGRHHQFPQTFNLYFPPRFQCSLKKTGAKILWVKPGKSTASTLSANIVFHFLRRRMEPAAHIYYTTSPFLHSNFKLVWRSLKVNLVQIMLSFRFHERPISKHSKHLQAKWQAAAGVCSPNQLGLASKYWSHRRRRPFTSFFQRWRSWILMPDNQPCQLIIRRQKHFQHGLPNNQTTNPTNTPNHSLHCTCSLICK